MLEPTEIFLITLPFILIISGVSICYQYKRYKNMQNAIMNHPGGITIISTTNPGMPCLMNSSFAGMSTGFNTMSNPAVVQMQTVEPNPSQKYSSGFMNREKSF